MTWLVQSSLVNEPFSDPGLFIDFRFGRRALLFDLGDLTPLSPRQLLRVTHAFVSHTHMDHFVGFDRLLRVCLHRTTPLHLIGPAEFADRVEHKLRAYTLNLLDADSVDFVIVASEFSGAGFDRVCEFRAREAFRRREIPPVHLAPGLLLDEEEFRVEGTVIDHGIPCVAFAFEEKLRVNVWRDGLRRLGIPVGPWIREAKGAVRQGAPDNIQICVHDDLAISLGELKKHALRTALGQKVAYLVDLIYSERNIEKAVALARDADQLFIEAPFLDEDAHIAAERRHLTARQAGNIARRAGVRLPYSISLLGSIPGTSGRDPPRGRRRIPVRLTLFVKSLFARNLRKARHSKGLSHEGLAYEAGIDRTYVSALERGDYGATIDMVEKLAAVLDVEPSSLLQRSVKTKTQKSQVGPR